MRSICSYSTRCLVVLLAMFWLQTNVSWGQADGVFDLEFAGNVSYVGFQGDIVGGTYECILNQSNIGDPDDPDDPVHTGKGARGWSISMAASGMAVITEITTLGTAVDPVDQGGYFEGGFNKTELTTEAGAGTGCEGLRGAVSAIVLSFTTGNVLPENRPYVIAKITVEMIPEAVISRLMYVDGCKGAGQPVYNNVTQGGKTVKPSLGELLIRYEEPPFCCPAELNVGFSADVIIGSATPFEGIVSDTPQFCTASGGEIVTEVPSDTMGAGHVYVNIISNITDAPDPVPPNLGGAQGWSLSLLVEGDITLADTTTSGTAVDTYLSGGFNKTEVIDPAKNGGKEGAVSAVVLSFTTGNTLPPIGTETVLDMTVQSTVAQGVDDIAGTVKFESGLTGAGQPVTNAITVDGGTRSACNFDLASVAVVFRERSEQSFVRGNANNDAQVDIADPIWIINELFHEGPATSCQDAADANNDGAVDTSDAVYLIDYSFAGGAMPEAPFPDCGRDPEGDDDGLTCLEIFDMCK